MADEPDTEEAPEKPRHRQAEGESREDFKARRRGQKKLDKQRANFAAPPPFSTKPGRRARRGAPGLPPGKKLDGQKSATRSKLLRNYIAKPTESGLQMLRRRAHLSHEAVTRLRDEPSGYGATLLEAWAAEHEDQMKGVFKKPEAKSA